MRTGVTSTTFDSVVLGPGVVYKNFVSPASPGTIIGATAGGSSFTIEREFFSPEIDGLVGPIKGGEKLVKEVPKITAKFIEINKDTLSLALSGSSVATGGTNHDKVTSSVSVSVGNYQDICIVADNNNKTNPVVFVCKNALSTDPLQIDLGNGKSEVAFQVVFTGHYDPATPTLAPYELYMPKA